MPSIGEVEESFNDGQIAKILWRIRNYSARRNTRSYSRVVKCFGNVWRFGLDPARSHHRLWLVSNQRTTEYWFSAGYKRADGTERHIARARVIPQNAPVVSLTLDHSPCVTPSGELLLTCTIWKGESNHDEVVSRIAQGQGASSAGVGAHGRPPKVSAPVVSRIARGQGASSAGVGFHGRPSEGTAPDISILLEHLRDLLHSGDDQDFLLKVKEKQFRAHKCVLRARSPVFAAMFRSQMTECAEGSITIDDCDPDSFGEFLRYVYTGEVDISSASHALGLYYAAEKYDFPRLKELSVQFLKNSLTNAGISDVIQLAVSHNEGELLQQALAFLAAHLEEVFLTVEWQSFLTANPIQANEMCIKALQCGKKA